MNIEPPIHVLGLTLFSRALLLRASLALLALCVGPRLKTTLAWLRAPLPAYTLSLRGGIVDSCCVEHPGSRLLRARLDSPIDIELAPAQPQTRLSPETGPIFVHAFKAQDGLATRLPILMERTTRGTLKLRGVVRDVLDLPPRTTGAIDLLFGVSRSPLPPSYRSLISSAEGADQAMPMHVLTGRILLSGCEERRNDAKR